MNHNLTMKQFGTDFKIMKSFLVLFWFLEVALHGICSHADLHYFIQVWKPCSLRIGATGKQPIQNATFKKLYPQP